MPSKSEFHVTKEDGYIHLVTKGPLDLEHLEAPADAALAMAKKEGLTALLDDIREVDSSQVNVTIQAKGFGVVWKLRSFNKVAIVMNLNELEQIFMGTLRAMHLNSKFRAFDKEDEAIAWLKSEKK